MWKASFQMQEVIRNGTGRLGHFLEDEGTYLAEVARNAVLVYIFYETQVKSLHKEERL